MENELSQPTRSHSGIGVLMHKTVIITFIAFLAFWCGHSASGKINQGFLSVTFFLGSASFGFFAVLHLFKNNSSSPNPPWPLFLLLAFLGWHAYGSSYGLDGETSLLMAVNYLSGMILVLGFSIYSREPDILKTALWTFLVIGGIYGGLTILLIYKTDWWYLFVHFGIASLLTNPNILASFLLIPVALWPFLANKSQSSFEKNLACFTGVLSMIGLLLTRSRGGEILGVALLGFIFIYLQKNRKKGFLKITSIALLVLLASYMTPAYTFKWLKLDKYQFLPAPVEEKILKVSLGSSMNLRMNYWEKSWEFIQEHPWKGSGPYAFVTLYNQSKTRFSPNAHNLMVQTTVDAGFIGLMLLLACLGAAFFKLKRRLDGEGQNSHSMVLMLGLILMATQAHYLVEYLWHIPFFLALFIFLVTMICAGTTPASRKKFMSLYISLMILVAGFGGTLTYRLFKYQQIMNDLAVQVGFGSGTKPLFDEAKQYCPQCEQPYLEISKYYLHNFFHDPSSGETDWAQKAAKELLEARKINFHSEKYYLAWGELLWAQGKNQEALGAYLKARKINPNDPWLDRKIKDLQ